MGNPTLTTGDPERLRLTDEGIIIAEARGQEGPIVIVVGSEHFPQKRNIISIVVFGGQYLSMTGNNVFLIFLSIYRNYTIVLNGHLWSAIPNVKISFHVR